MADFEEDVYSKIFSTLRHPVRRRMLRLLSEKRMSYTEILNNLNVTTGFLNYHLENTGDLISKNDDGQYYLTSFGEAALTLISNIEMPEKRPQHFKILNKRISWKYVTLSIISILAISNIFILYDNNLMYTKKYTIVKNKVAQNRILFNKIISIINSTTSNGRIIS